jgi:hypothetical protein
MMPPAVIAAFARNKNKGSNFSDLILLRNSTTGAVGYYPRYYLLQPDFASDYIAV